MSRDLFDVAGLHVLVTGATQGIGRMIAEGFAGRGAAVTVTSRTESDCTALAEALGEGAEAVAVDLSADDGADALAARIAERPLDVLVNNAGVTWGAPLEEYPDHAWDRVIGLNLKAPFKLTVACLPALRRAVRRRGRASVINIGSVDGLLVPRWESYAYSSSKAAMHHLTRHLAKRLAPEQITVNAVAPGVFPSRMTGRAFTDGESAEIVGATPLGRLGEADDIAGAALYLASPAAGWVTGVVLPVDGGWGTLR
ncbi:SDR family oxidoreductase [Actinomadura rugatobispora]|uniref:SDR family oxidoreductase n=1 Tax=Actinomadura rugatobispora TaxID=1994 RepID=A0ABW0ZYT0_9ACTN|nr:SDR family oxidoreductase [Actinomadura rugatobispora]